MQSASQELDAKIHTLQNQIKQYPQGKLICSRNENRFKWYISDGKTHTYIPRKDRAFAEELAAKNYLSQCLQELTQEKAAIDSYLKKHDSINTRSEQMLTEHAGYKELLSPYFQPASEELTKWMQEPFEKNPNYPEQLTVKTASGHLVRSKSEALIDTMLYMKKIPFRYECALKFGSTTLYPDFTIRHPTNGNTLYWEHLGLMDDPSYFKNAYSKLQFYTSNGIVPSIQLIITCETKESPLDTQLVELLIEHYFC